MSTKEHYERMHDALLRMGHGELADFVADLAVGDHDVRELVEIFVERRNPETAAEKVRSAITRLRHENEYVRYDDGFDFSVRLYNLLERIEKDLLPLVPDVAMEVLAMFIASDGDLAERVDDSAGAVGEPMSHACELFARSAENGGSRKLTESLFRELTRNDDYGYRGDLVSLQDRILGGGPDRLP